MKKVLFILSLTCIFGTINAQKIKFKKGKVMVDGTECLNYDISPNNVEFTTNDDSQTIILKFIRTGIGQNGGLYTKVVFVEQDKSFTSKSYIFNKKILVKKLLSNKVLKDCKIDETKIDKFLMKYDEKIEETLIRF